MTKFLERMREELVRRNYAESTIRSHLRIVEDFHQYVGKRLDHLGPDDRTLMMRIREICRATGIVSYSCEDNFFDLWYGPQDDHGCYRYAVHYDFWQERTRLGGCATPRHICGQ